MAMDGGKGHQGGGNKTSTRKSPGSGAGNTDKSHKKTHKKKKKHKKSTKEKGHNSGITSSSPEGETGEVSVTAKGENVADSGEACNKAPRALGLKTSPSSKQKLGSQIHRTNGRASAPIHNQGLDRAQNPDKSLRASSVNAMCKSSSNISISSQGSRYGSHTSLPRISSKTSLTVSHEDVLHNSTLRWDMQLEDPVAEAERIRVYKINRRKRYIAAQNKKYSDWVAALNSEIAASLAQDTATARDEEEGNLLKKDSFLCSDHTEVASPIRSVEVAN